MKKKIEKMKKKEKKWKKNEKKLNENKKNTIVLDKHCRNRASRSTWTRTSVCTPSARALWASNAATMTWRRATCWSRSVTSTRCSAASPKDPFWSSWKAAVRPPSASNRVTPTAYFISPVASGVWMVRHCLDFRPISCLNFGFYGRDRSDFGFLAV